MGSAYANKKNIKKSSYSSGRKKKISDIRSYFKKEQKLSYEGKENKPESKDNFLSRHVDTDINQIKDNANLLFFQNKIKSEPNGDYIENILEKWSGDFNLLERHHGYIQWLFPLKQNGMNTQAEPLTREEIQEISSSGIMKNRLLRAYKMMLEFYGFTMVNDDNGEVVPSAHHSKRIAHLKKSRHNFLRITRILSSLSLLGLEHIKYPFLEELIHLSCDQDASLFCCQNSCSSFWIPSITDLKMKQQFQELVTTLKKQSKDDFTP